MNVLLVVAVYAATGAAVLIVPFLMAALLLAFGLMWGPDVD